MTGGAAAAYGKARVKKVLVVDDEKEIRNVVAAMVRAIGYNAVTAGNASLAVELWRTEHFDVAVIDYVLPDGSGAELAEKLLAEKRSMRVILTSGMTEDNVEIPRGATFLGKPFTAAELHTLIREDSNGG